jgi:hypothetical protein
VCKTKKEEMGLMSSIPPTEQSLRISPTVVDKTAHELCCIFGATLPALCNRVIPDPAHFIVEKKTSQN